ncbi:MAG: RNA polymerase sigma factor [bacterium]|nr:RNA polymerase sigma factor [bacterium]
MSLKTDILGQAIRKAAAFLQPGETLSGEQFQLLLHPLKDHLYNYIFKALNFSEDADDVYQETVMRAFKYKASFKSGKGGTFKTWIFTVASNEVKAYFKRNRGEAKPVNLEDHPNVTHDETGDDRHRRLVRDIYEVALELNPRQRRVFFLFYDHQFAIKEISEITGLKEGNIKFILNQSRGKVREKVTGAIK